MTFESDSGQGLRCNAVGSEAHYGIPVSQSAGGFASSRGLFDPTSLTLDDIRAICATALAHVPDHRQKEIVQARPSYEQIDMALAMVRLRNSAQAD
jgi:hypothetical protein